MAVPYRPMEIHPRSFGDSLSDLIGMLGKVWRPLLLPALFSSVIVAAASYLILDRTGALDVIDLTLNNPESFQTLSEDQFFDLMIVMGRGFVWVALVSVVLYGFLYLVAARAVAGVVAEQPSTAPVASTALRLFLPWLAAMILTYIGVALGFLLLIIPGVWLGISLSMTTPVIAIEEKGPIPAIRRSYELVKGHWWETLGFLLLVGLIGGTATQFIQIFAVPVFLVGAPSVAFGITIAIALAMQGLIIAAIAVAITIWYLNLRARTDGPFRIQIN